MKTKLTSVLLTMQAPRVIVDQQVSSLHVNIRKMFTPEWPAI